MTEVSVNLTPDEVKAGLTTDGLFDWLTSLILRPNANGDHIGLSNDPPNGANYEFVDDVIPDGEGSVVYVAGAVTEYDLYEVEDHTTELGSIISVTVYHNSTMNGPAGNYAREKIKTHGVEYEGDIDTLIQLPVFTEFSYTWAVNPNTSAAWTWDEIDDLQIGVWLDPVAAGHFPQTTQVYVEVKYIAPDTPIRELRAELTSDEVKVRLK